MLACVSSLLFLLLLSSLSWGRLAICHFDKQKWEQLTELYVFFLLLFCWFFFCISYCTYSQQSTVLHMQHQNYALHFSYVHLHHAYFHIYTSHILWNKYTNTMKQRALLIQILFFIFFFLVWHKQGCINSILLLLLFVRHTHC